MKHQEGGLQTVCEVMERYEKKAVTEANVKAIKKMIRDYHATKESILEDYNCLSTKKVLCYRIQMSKGDSKLNSW